MSIGARVFVLVDLKGGVGETVTAVNLAACFATEENLRSLMVGLDPQANAATGVGRDISVLEGSIFVRCWVLRDVSCETSGGTFGLRVRVVFRSCRSVPACSRSSI